MKLPYIKNDKKLQVHCFNYLYSYDLYRDFNSVAHLTEWLQDEGLISRKKTARQEYEFYYTSIYADKIYK